MTDRKKLKKLVRDRMAVTGESYTTARMHVLAGRPTTLPAGLVPGYRTFGARKHRESSLVAHALAAQGVAYSEAMIAGLAGGIGFMYAVFEYKDMPPLLTVVAQHHPAPWAMEALTRLNVSVVEKHSGKPRPLPADRPVLATVDRSRLPWHGLEPGFGMDPYVVAVAGIDGDTVYVDDSGLYALSVEDFNGAWSAYRKGRHHALVIGEAGQVDLPRAIRSAIEMTVDHLTGPVLGNSFDVNFGFSGMAKFAAQLRDTRKKDGWAKRFGAPVPFAHGMRRIYECLELEYTAPGATRPVYADFLAEAAPLLGDHLTDAAALFRESGARWSALAALALNSVSELPYADLAEERLALMFSRGREAEPEIRELTQRLDALAAESPHPADPDLFAGMADVVDECLALEQEAVTLLATRGR
ncbi:BtrH N-terminal domain-containing protein [Actinocrispum wychmicini]|uniref:Butirosin biosynthesis protein H-like n=1 Tax=Actinocrispum wychmicini TaxID=1213861 RepID=A0A4R2JEQ5_9PSEU|nr:BtrH N-terminal domain-containing protein [Actinocrispum wychmicini]TCO57017.1 butirosin biosynthesis protein H-like [Actinocrispum wychmicini]